MRSWFSALLAIGVSPPGVFLLAALDSTIFVALPFGVDLAVMGLSARAGAWAWAVPLLATAGSVAGSALTYWMGIEAGEQGLERFVSPQRLKKIRQWVSESGAITLAAFDLMPPPFPFTAFVLAAGALKVRRTTFFSTLALCRLLRFGVETVVAIRYGETVSGWLAPGGMASMVQWIVLGAFVISLVPLIRLARSRFDQRSVPS